MSFCFWKNVTTVLVCQNNVVGKSFYALNKHYLFLQPTPSLKITATVPTLEL